MPIFKKKNKTIITMIIFTKKRGRFYSLKKFFNYNLNTEKKNGMSISYNSGFILNLKYWNYKFVPFECRLSQKKEQKKKSRTQARQETFLNFLTQRHQILFFSSPEKPYVPLKKICRIHDFPLHRDTFNPFRYFSLFFGYILN